MLRVPLAALAATLALASAAEARDVVVTSFDGPLGIAAALHAAAALRTGGDVLPCGLATLGAFAGLDAPAPEGGRLALPPGPGLLGGAILGR